MPARFAVGSAPNTPRLRRLHKMRKIRNSSAGRGAERPGRARSAGQEQDALFRPTLVKVLLVQVVTLILLWLLQAAYHG